MSGEFNGFVLLGVLWFLLNLMTSGRRKSSRESRPSPPNRPGPKPVPAGRDSTQQEGFRLEQVLRELRRSLEEAAQPAGSIPIPLSRGPDPERGGSLEVDPEVRSLEDDFQREERRRVDQDDEAADIEVRRIQAAANRNAPRTQTARPSPLQRPIQQPADRTAARTYTAQQLRDAVVWREILGPPVSER